MIKIDNISFAYKKGENVLNGVCAELTGGFYALVGKNGCGKSTLMNVITGTLKAESGKIEIDGIEVSDKGYADKISYLPQVFDPYPNLTVQEVLTFVAGLKGIDKKEISDKIEDAAEKTNVAGFLKTRFGKCSEGTKRRVGIAATLLGERELVILDEPTAGLDPSERARFYETVRRCFEGKTVLISTHILEDIEFLADNVLMMTDGKISYDGLYEDYCNVLNGRLYVAYIPEHSKKDYKIISEQCYANGKTVCRVVSDKALPSEWEPVPTEPTNEDIWEYFERRYNE